MNQRVFAVLAVFVLVFGLGLAAMGQQQKAITIRVVIGGNDTLAPSRFEVAKGSLVRVTVVNRSNKEHGLMSSQTKDVIFTQPGETKTLEFTVTQLPLSFACVISGHTESFELKPPSK